MGNGVLLFEAEEQEEINHLVLRLGYGRALLLGLAAATTLTAELDARRLDSQGQLKSNDVKIYDVILLEGSPYRRLARRDDRPLPPSDEKKEQEKLARSIAERRKETAGQRALRLAEYESRPEWLREAWNELPEAFDFRLTGEEKLGRQQRVRDRSHTASGIPTPVPHTAKVLVQLQGKLWVDKQDYHLVKAEIVPGPLGQRLARGL